MLEDEAGKPSSDQCLVSIVLVEDVERKGEEGGLLTLTERKLGLAREGTRGECVI